jgi:hypothetical protein
MRVYRFSSESHFGVSAFASDRMGANLPKDYGPWRAAGGGYVSLSASPVDAASIAVRRDGYLLSNGARCPAQSEGTVLPDPVRCPSTSYGLIEWAREVASTGQAQVVQSRALIADARRIIASIRPDAHYAAMQNRSG